jgi:hypothetical protein
MKMHPFNRLDWYGYAGAQGSPLMSDEELTVTFPDGNGSASGCVIIDDNGASLVMAMDGFEATEDEPDGPECFEIYVKDVPRAWIEAAVAGWAVSMTEEQIIKFFPSWSDPMSGAPKRKTVPKPKERLLFERASVTWLRQTTFNVGEEVVIHAGAPGTGHTVYVITRIDDDGIWAIEKSNDVRILTPGEVR